MAQNLSDKVVALLKEEKERQGVSNYALAKKCKLSEASLSYIFSCQRRPTLYTLLILTDALDLKLSQIFNQLDC